MIINNILSVIVLLFTLSLHKGDYRNEEIEFSGFCFISSL